MMVIAACVRVRVCVYMCGWRDVWSRVEREGRYVGAWGQWVMRWYLHTSSWHRHFFKYYSYVGNVRSSFYPSIDRT